MPKPVESWRLFIAVELPRDVRQKIKQHIDQLRIRLPYVRASWVSEDNLHLTIKFLGDTPVDRVEAVTKAVAIAADKTTAFEINIAGCGAFPSRGKPNVLWIGLEDLAGGLKQLYRYIEDSCSAAGLAKDTRPFHSHLTIARLRDSRGAREIAQLHLAHGFEAQTFAANDVCLIRSELSSAGSRYTVLSRPKFRPS